MTVESPTVTRVEYDPRQPPADMPSVRSDGGGVCRNVFQIEARVVSAREALSSTGVRAYPEDFAIVTRLHVTIYTPLGFPPKLRAHEEAHRAIGEYYYRNAEAAARDAALALVGRPFEADGVDRAAAEQEVTELVLAALKDAYMQKTHARSAAANARFDALTDHGRAAIDEAEAIATALAADP